MAKTSLKARQTREAKFSTQAYTRCQICGRPRAVMQQFGICRCCFRDLASDGQIPGVQKSSW